MATTESGDDGFQLECERGRSGAKRPRLDVDEEMRIHRDRVARFVAQQRRVREVTAAIGGSADLRESLLKVLQSLKEITHCDFIGVRLKDGDDFPYFVSTGFSEEFLRQENFLCRKVLAEHRSSSGSSGGSGNGSGSSLGTPAQQQQQQQQQQQPMETPVMKPVMAPKGAPRPQLLDCMCGNVLTGLTDPKMPFFTRRGSFWTPDAHNVGDELLGFGCPIRGLCMREGFHSMAIVPIRTPDGQIIGTLHVDHPDVGMHTADQVELLEVIADAIGIAVKDRYVHSRMRSALSFSLFLLQQQAAQQVPCCGRGPAGCPPPSSSRGDIEDIGKVLGSLEMSHYESRFRDKGVSSATAIKYATVEDLTGAMGMSPVSAHRLLLEGESRALQDLTISGVQLRRKIGQGAFGSVYEGLWGSASVALKTVRHNRHAANLVAEMILHSRLSHPNVIQFFGVCSIDGSLYMVNELAAGSVLSLLRSGSIIAPSPVLYDFARGAAAGMCYLSSVGIVHRDLSCRNLLYRIDSGRHVVKISDFGLAIVNGAVNPANIEEGLPVRWSAPEVLSRSVSTIAGDVWSFGVVLWELFTLGRQPYEGHTNGEVPPLINAGTRLERPANCPADVWELMSSCWAKDPAERPTFEYLLEMLTMAKPPPVQTPPPQQQQQRQSLATTAGTVFVAGTGADGHTKSKACSLL